MTSRRAPQPAESATLDGLPTIAAAGIAAGYVERRTGVDRRRRLWWSLLYGGVAPRRLRGRRVEDHYRPVIDWHGPGLLTSCLLILLLCAADAFLTLTLISKGATEANPVMALWVYHDVRAFTIVKMALTGSGVLALVAIARFRVFRWLRVASFVHALLVGYTALIGYEIWLLVKIGVE